MYRHNRHLMGFYLPPAAAAAAGILLVSAGIVTVKSVPGAIFLTLLVPVAAAAAITVFLLRSRRALSDAGVYLKNPGTLAETPGLGGVVLDYERTITRGKKQVLKVLAAAAVGKRGRRAGEINDALLEMAAAESARQLEAEGKTEKAKAQTEAGPADEAEEESARKCILRAWGSTPDPGLLKGHKVLLGSAETLRAAGIPIIPAKETGEILYLAVDGSFQGYLVIGDPVRTEAAETVEELRSAGVQEIALLAVEDQKGAEAFAAGHGIDEVLSETEEGLCGVLREWKDRCDGTIAVVSGRKALTAVGGEAALTIAMGRKGGGTRAAVRAADAVLRTGDLRGVSLTIAEGRHTVAMIRRTGTGALILQASLLVLRFVKVI